MNAYVIYSYMLYVKVIGITKSNTMLVITRYRRIKKGIIFFNYKYMNIIIKTK